MDSFNDYTFSDDNKTFSQSSAQMVYINENINLTNTEKMIIDFITFNSSNRFESNSFSFDFTIPKPKQKFNLSDKGVAYLNYKNNSDDLILYSKYEDSIVELLGFGDYHPPNTNGQIDAENRAYFKGTINNLKKYMKFTAKIINSTTLRFLEESFNVTAYGVMDIDNIDLDNGLVIYNIT